MSANPREALAHGIRALSDNTIAFNTADEWSAELVKALSPWLREWQPEGPQFRNGKHYDIIIQYKNGKQVRVPDCYWHRKAMRWMTHSHDKDGWSRLRDAVKVTHVMPLPSPPDLSTKEPTNDPDR